VAGAGARGGLSRRAEDANDDGDDHKQQQQKQRCASDQPPRTQMSPQSRFNIMH
jgi:hypothetical protein